MKKYRSVWVLIISMFFMASAYTMLIPFLPLYLLELGVSQARVHLWTGLVFSSAFFVAGIMGPVWGKMADTRGEEENGCPSGLSYRMFLFPRRNCT